MFLIVNYKAAAESTKQRIKEKKNKKKTFIWEHMYQGIREVQNARLIGCKHAERAVWTICCHVELTETEGRGAEHRQRLFCLGLTRVTLV